MAVVAARWTERGKARGSNGLREQQQQREGKRGEEGASSGAKDWVGGANRELLFLHRINCS